MSIWTVLGLLLGLAGLLGGADLLVKGAASIAHRLGVAPVVIGLTVVALGTSAPELAVSVNAGVAGNGDVGLGNVVGSNIANVLLILGSSALAGGLAVSQRLVRLDIPVLMVTTGLTVALALDNGIGRVDGAVLLAGLLAYNAWVVRSARRERAEVLAEYRDELAEIEGEAATRPTHVLVGLVVAGLGALVSGSSLLVRSATDIASALGVSDLVIGLTIVAVGTSLPELATSILAVRRGERDIAVGNVVGSNLFNLLGVLGITALVVDGGIAVDDAVLRLDVPVMLAAAFALLPICWNGFAVWRWEGGVLLGCYTVYVAYVGFEAGDHAAADVIAPIGLVVAPLVVVTFVVTGMQGWRRHRSRAVTPPT